MLICFLRQKSVTKSDHERTGKPRNLCTHRFWPKARASSRCLPLHRPDPWCRLPCPGRSCRRHCPRRQPLRCRTHHLLCCRPRLLLLHCRSRNCCWRLSLRTAHTPLTHMLAGRSLAVCSPFARLSVCSLSCSIACRSLALPHLPPARTDARGSIKPTTVLQSWV